jgi:L-ascorbate metabolism protein UlaG (beta-lactamase superfamily)
MLVLSTILLYSDNQDQKTDKIVITYIASEGFFIEVHNQKILVDALFGRKELDFCDVPPKEVLTKMEFAQKPFNNVDLITVSHNHVDHIHPDSVWQHLKNNPHGTFISTHQSVKALNSLGPMDSSLKNRIKAITPDFFKKTDIEINDIKVTVMRLKHGEYFLVDEEGRRYNKHENVENLGFLFKIKGITFFHCGDACYLQPSDCREFKLEKENIDVAFLHRAFMHKTDCPQIDIIKRCIKPKHIILMHIHPREFDHYSKVAKALKNDFPSVTIFKKPMESKIFPN